MNLDEYGAQARRRDQDGLARVVHALLLRWRVGSCAGDREARGRQWQRGLAGFWLLDWNLGLISQNVVFWMGFL